MLSRFYRIPERDGQTNRPTNRKTDRHTDRRTELTIKTRAYL